MDTYYYNDETLVSGSTILYNNSSLINIISNIIGVHISEGIKFRFATDASGVYTATTVYEHTLDGATFYSPDYMLASGSVMYFSSGSIGALAGSLTGNNVYNNGAADYNWSTDANGVLTLTLAVNSIAYNGTTYYYDQDDTLTSGITLYTDSALSTPASNILFLDASNLKRITTDESGVYTATTVYAHTLEGTTYYSVDSTLVSETSIIYGGDGNPIYSTGSSWITDSNGVITLFSAITINRVTYYSPDTTVTPGTTVFYSETSFATAAAGLFGINASGDPKLRVTTDENGVYDETTVYEHTLDGTTYYSEDATLATGSVVYNNTGALAASVTGLNTVSINGTDKGWYTDGSGVLTLVGSYSFGGSTYYYEDESLTSGSTTLYTDVFVVSPASNVVVMNLGAEPYTRQSITNGVYSSETIYKHTDSLGTDYYSPSITLATGSVLYDVSGSLAVSLYTNTSDTSTFTVSGTSYVWSTDSQGALTLFGQLSFGTSNYYYVGSLSSSSVLFYSDKGSTAVNDGILYFDGSSSVLYKYVYNTGYQVIQLYSVSIDAVSYLSDTATLANGVSVMYSSDGSFLTGVSGSYDDDYSWSTDANGLFYLISKH